MKLEGNSIEVREGIGEAVRQYIVNDKKKGIHLTELYIPLKYYFYHVYPGVGLTDREIYNFIIGRGYHSIVEAIADYFRTPNLSFVIAEQEMLYKDVGMLGEGIRFTPDVVFMDTRGTYVPFEIKTTRVKYISQVENVPEPYIFQLKGYISMINKKVLANEYYGYLYAINVTYPEVGFFKLTLTADEVEEVKQDLIKRYNLLVKAIESKNPDILLKEYGKIPDWAGREMIYPFAQIGVDVSKYVEIVERRTGEEKKIFK